MREYEGLFSRETKVAMTKLAMLCAVLMVTLVANTGCEACSTAYRTSQEVSRDANEFNVTRRITVLNTRTDTVLWRLTGNFATFESDGDLDVICQLPDGTYSKSYFDLNEWTTYVVEDLNGTDIKPYTYEMEYLPQDVAGTTVELG